MCKFDAKQVKLKGDYKMSHRTKQAKFEEDYYNVSHRRTREFGAERGSSSVAKTPPNAGVRVRTGIWVSTTDTTK